MDKILGLFLLIIFGGAGLISIFAIINLILPIPVERTRAALENNLGRSLLLGLVNSLFAGLVMALLLWPTRIGGVIAGIFVLLAGLVALTVIALIMIGLAANTSLIGSRMGETKSPVASHLRGGLLLLLACLTPYIGWFVFTPLVLWVGLGAAIQALMHRKEKVV